MATSLTELSERFVICHAAVSTMLAGYWTLGNLKEAIAAVDKGPPPEAVSRRMG